MSLKDRAIQAAEEARLQAAKEAELQLQQQVAHPPIIDSPLERAKDRLRLVVMSWFEALGISDPPEVELTAGYDGWNEPNPGISAQASWTLEGNSFKATNETGGTGGPVWVKPPGFGGYVSGNTPWELAQVLLRAEQIRAEQASKKSKWRRRR
jgi:hypothetical protein